MPLVRPLTDVGRDDLAEVGGKGASLGELIRTGIQVPEGFAVTTDAFRRAMAALDDVGEIASTIGSLDLGDSRGIAEATAWARERVEGSVMPDDLVHELRHAYHDLCVGVGRSDAPVAVRSSATSEDSAEASFAGLQDTLLWVRGEDTVLDAVRRCWASLYSVESVTYRRRRDLPEHGLAMAVVVQRMVAARTSGVMFTCSPATGDRSVVAIDASWGLGSAVVSGAVTPDHYLVSKVTGEVVRRQVADKAVRDVPGPDGRGVHSEPVPDDLRREPALDPGEMSALVGLARTVEAHYGCPQDIEWAIAQGPQVEGIDAPPLETHIYLLQSRPETAWVGRQAEPIASPKGKPFEHVLSFLAPRQGPGHGSR